MHPNVSQNLLTVVHFLPFHSTSVVFRTLQSGESRSALQQRRKAREQRRKAALEAASGREGMEIAAIIFVFDTLPETNIAPKNGWLEYYFPIGEAYFQGLC